MPRECRGKASDEVRSQEAAGAEMRWTEIAEEMPIRQVAAGAGKRWTETVRSSPEKKEKAELQERKTIPERVQLQERSRQWNSA
jgi:hypothetical protein